VREWAAALIHARDPKNAVPRRALSSRLLEGLRVRCEENLCIIRLKLALRSREELALKKGCTEGTCGKFGMIFGRQCERPS